MKKETFVFYENGFYVAKERNVFLGINLFWKKIGLFETENEAIIYCLKRDKENLNDYS